jgi:hypothetical protein
MIFGFEFGHSALPGALDTTLTAFPPWGYEAIGIGEDVEVPPDLAAAAGEKMPWAAVSKCSNFVDLNAIGAAV